MPRRIMIGLISFLLVLFFLLFGLVRFLESTSVFYPGKVVNLTPAQVGLPFEDLYLTTSDGVKINAWLVKQSHPASTVIFAHGNAGTMGERVIKMRFWYDLGLNVMMFDYRGYGHSEGNPSEKGVYLDALAVYDYLQTRKDIAHERIIGYGASLGGVVMIHLASQRRLAAVVVESSITSAKDMAKRLYPFLPSFFMGIKFDSLSKIDKITCPKLFLHSREDHIVPFSMGQKLFEKASEPKKFIVINGGHNDMGSITDLKVRDQFKEFLGMYSLL
jgi:fermentation-respiration switch protein FrsA (DUF1100 family)